MGQLIQTIIVALISAALAIVAMGALLVGIALLARLL